MFQTSDRQHSLNGCCKTQAKRDETTPYPVTGRLVGLLDLLLVPVGPWCRNGRSPGLPPGRPDRPPPSGNDCPVTALTFSEVAPAMETAKFIPFEQVVDTFEKILEVSPADETELVWLQRRYGAVSDPSMQRRGGDFLENPRLTVLVRVVESGRQGWYRTETPDPHLLEGGVRQALALAKVQERAKRQPVLPKPSSLQAEHPLCDEAISELGLRDARRHLEQWCGPECQGRLSWSETRLGIFNSHGLRRRARATEVTFSTLAGSGAGTGRASASARALADLHPQNIRQRALDTASDEAVSDSQGHHVPLVLAPEASIELINLLNAYALSGRSYLDGTSFLAQHRNVQVFSRDFHLLDDGTCLPGLPFPFDFEGSPKLPLELIVKGQPTTPALTKYQGGQTGLEPTAQAVGGQDALFGNLFLQPGEAEVADLLQAAEGGLFIGWLEPPECYDPNHLYFRGIARGVRRIRNGRLAEPLPDQIWEDSLLRAFARLRVIGRDSVMRSTSTTLLGAISAPSLVLDASEGMRPLG